jgi:ribonuclease Z
MLQVPEVAFTGDTTIEFVKDPANSPVLRAKLLIMECTFLDDTVDQDGARSRGHMHVRDLAEHAACFQVCQLHARGNYL